MLIILMLNLAILGFICYNIKKVRKFCELENLDSKFLISINVIMMASILSKYNNIFKTMSII